MRKHNIIPVLTLLVFLFAGVSCNDKWDDHYEQTPGGSSDLTLMELLRSKEELSTFVRLLEVTGYDDTLSLSRAFTVFAPVNEALAGIDMSNEEALLRLVGNHITNFTYSTAGLVDTSTYYNVALLNGKYGLLTRFNNQYIFESEPITDRDLMAKNGILHILEDYAPYVYNIWEFIQETQGLDSLRNYLNSLTQLVFDKNASYDNNNVFIDSMFMEQNQVLAYLAALDDEVIDYTTILPDNQAWIEAYNKLFPFYRSQDKVINEEVVKKADEWQVEKTKWAIIQDFAFRGIHEYPTRLDSLVSTYGNVFYDPDYLFAGSRLNIQSNGLAYVTSELKNKLEDSWLQDIVVEAERDVYSLRTTTTNITLQTYSSYGTPITASENYYVRFAGVPAGNVTVSATFPVPNTLAGVKYNIYCVTVPTYAIDTTDVRPFKINCYLTYIGENGELKKDERTLRDYVTNPKDTTKVLIASEFEFPYSNVMDFMDYFETIEDYTDYIKVFVKIENAATSLEERQRIYSRQVGIDCIILEPVIE